LERCAVGCYDRHSKARDVIHTDRKVELKGDSNWVLQKIN
jgi:hypothetical protein